MWDTPWFRNLLLAARKFFIFPDMPLYGKWPGNALLPAPTWRTCGFWVRDLTCDGDIEDNPGPVAVNDLPSQFWTFCDCSLDEFTIAVPGTDVARGVCELKARLRNSPDGYEVGLQDLQQALGTAPADLLKCVALF